MADIYSICFYGGLVLASLLLITSIVLFIVLKIPSVIGELTGRTAKKSMEEMKANNRGTSAVSKKEQGKYYNQATGKIKVRQAKSAEDIKKNNDNTTTILGDSAVPDAKITAGKPKEITKKMDAVHGKTTDNDEKETDVLRDGEEATDVLRDDEEVTDVLRDGEEATDVLRDSEEATDVLRDDEDETSVLSAEAETSVLGTDDEAETSVLSREDSTTVLTGMVSSGLSSKVKVTYNVVVIHTDEQL